MYKLLLTDLDGTLLKDDNTLTKENYDAIHKIYNMGVPVVVCSGRSNMSLDEIVKRYDLPKTYIIGFNGGIIYKDNNIIDHIYLDNSLAFEILENIEKFNCQPLMYQQDSLWIEKETAETINYAKRSYITPVKVSKLKKSINEKVSKIIILGENKELKKAETYFKDILNNRASVVFSSENLLEFNPLNVHKGYALKILAEHLNINIEDVVAAGDSYNDIEMIETAGLGVAMANSNDDIKVKADYITQNDNNNSGIAEIINKFF